MCEKEGGRRRGVTRGRAWVVCAGKVKTSKAKSGKGSGPASAGTEGLEDDPVISVDGDEVGVFTLNECAHLCALLNDLHLQFNDVRQVPFTYGISGQRPNARTSDCLNWRIVFWGYDFAVFASHRSVCGELREDGGRGAGEVFDDGDDP